MIRMVDGPREYLTKLLPVDAWLAGMRLIFVGGWFDPYYIIDRWGDVLYEWEYEPSLAELDAVCRGLLASKRCK